MGWGVNALTFFNAMQRPGCNIVLPVTPVVRDHSRCIHMMIFSTQRTHVADQLGAHWFWSSSPSLNTTHSQAIKHCC